MLPTILRNTGWLLSSRAVNAIFSLVYLALATRTLGLTGFGEFSLIIVLAQGITGIASFSTWQGVVLWGNDPVNAGKAAGFALALDAASILIGALVCAIAVWFAPLWLPLPEGLRPHAFALCLAALIAIRSTPTGLLRLHGRYDLATLADASQPVIRAVGSIAAALWCPEISGFVAAWAMAELVCAAAYWLLAFRLQRFTLSDVNFRDMPARAEGVWRFVWSTNLARTQAVVAKQGLLLLIGAAGGAALAGAYRVASQLGQALVQLGEAVSRAVYPEFVKAPGSSQELARKIFRLSLATGALAMVLAIAAGQHVLHVLAGAEFAFAYPALVVLSAGGVLELFVAGWDALLIASGLATASVIIRASFLCLGLALVPFALATFGLMGAALCMAMTSAGVAIALSTRVRFHHQRRESR